MIRAPSGLPATACTRCTQPCNRASSTAGWAPTGSSARTPMASALSAPTASNASTAVAPSRAPATSAVRRRWWSCRCIKCCNRRFTSPWSRTWSVAAWAATTATCSAWPIAWPGVTARCWPWCLASTRKTTFPQPVLIACWSSKGMNSTVMHRSNWCRACALWITSSTRATGCCPTAAPVAANWAGVLPQPWASARRRGSGRSRTGSAVAVPGQASRI
ncbi:hypothetical protein D3C77_287980 [compost metagenome]